MYSHNNKVTKAHRVLEVRLEMCGPVKNPMGRTGLLPRVSWILSSFISSLWMTGKSKIELEIN